MSISRVFLFLLSLSFTERTCLILIDPLSIIYNTRPTLFLLLQLLSFCAIVEVFYLKYLITGICKYLNLKFAKQFLFFFVLFLFSFYFFLFITYQTLITYQASLLFEKQSMQSLIDLINNASENEILIFGIFDTKVQYL